MNILRAITLQPMLEEGGPSLVDCMVVAWRLYGGRMVALKVSSPEGSMHIHLVLALDRAPRVLRRLGVDTRAVCHSSL